MRNRTTAIGALLGTGVGLAWGGQFVVGKSALGSINAFPLSTLRYALAAGLWILLLAVLEGRSSLGFGGRGLRLLGLGTLGIAAFNLLTYTGLAHAQPESASLIVALSPLLTALVLWRRTRVRPSATTFGLLAVALFGVALVISNGNPASIIDGAIGWGDLLVLGGIFSFVLYGLGGASFRDFSPLRYTALTAGLGWLVLAAATAVALAAGLVDMPSTGQLTAVGPQIAYLAIPGAFIAVLAWNGAIRLLGAQNAALFGNLIPVTTFVIEIARGYRPGAAAVAGATVTIAALVANNLLARRPARRRTRVSMQPARGIEIEAA